MAATGGNIEFTFTGNLTQLKQSLNQATRLAQQSVGQVNRATAGHGRRGTEFFEAPHLRSERRVGTAARNFVNNLGGIQTGAEAAGAAVQALEGSFAGGLGIGVAAIAGIAIYEKFTAAIKASEKAHTALAMELSKPMGTLTGLSASDLQAQVKLVHEATAEVQKTSSSPYVKGKALAGVAGGAFEQTLGIKPSSVLKGLFDATPMGALWKYSTAVSGFAYEQTGLKGKVDAARAKADQPGREQILAGIKREHRLQTLIADTSAKEVEEKREGLEGSDEDAAVMRIRRKAKEESSALKTRLGGQPIEAANLARQLMDISAVARMDEAAAHKKFGFKKEEEELQNRILNLEALGMTKSEQHSEALKGKIDMLKGRLDTGTTQEKTALGTQIHGLQNEQLRDQYEKQNEPGSAVSTPERREAAKFAAFAKQQDGYEKSAEQFKDVAAGIGTSLDIGAYKTNPAAYSRSPLAYGAPEDPSLKGGGQEYQSQLGALSEHMAAPTHMGEFGGTSAFNKFFGHKGEEAANKSLPAAPASGGKSPGTLLDGAATKLSQAVDKLDAALKNK
jgi:hypothetical protein